MSMNYSSYEYSATQTDPMSGVSITTTAYFGNGTSFEISPEQHSERMLTAGLFGFVSSWGVVCNLLPILLTFCTEMRKNNVHVLIATLSMADLLCSCSMVFGQIMYTMNRENLSKIPCQWLATITFTTSFVEFMLPPVLSLNRYIALYHAIYYDKIFTRKNVIIIVFSIWVFCSVIPIFFAVFGLTKFDDDNQHCCIVVKDSAVFWSVIYWLLIIIPLVGFCDGTMMFCNYKIYRKLTDHSAIQTLKSNVIRQNQELLYFLIADMTFPVMFHTTYHVAKFVLPNRTNVGVKRVFTTLYLTNSIVRGLVTLTMLRPYRMALKNAVLKVCRLSESRDAVPIYGNQVAPSSGTNPSSGTYNTKDYLYTERARPAPGLENDDKNPA